MRIAMVIAGPYPSPQGSQVFAGQMADQMGRRGHEVHFLTYGQGEQVNDGAFVHHRLPRIPGDESLRSGPRLIKPLLDAVMVRALARIVRRHRIEVIHAHNYEAALVGLAVRRRVGVPVLYHSHNLMGDELATYFGGMVLKRCAEVAGRYLDRSVPRRADHVIALCDYSAEALLSVGVEKRRLSVIPAAIDDDVVWGQRGAAKRGMGIDEDTRVVGYCGNLDGYQNLPLLFAAARTLTRRKGRGKLMIIIVTHLNKRQIHAARSRLRVPDSVAIRSSSCFAEDKGLIEASDVVVLPRRRGSGYPIKLLNYMSAGRATVTAGCGAKVIRDDVDGLVVDDDDAGGMAAAIAALAWDRRRAQRLGACARRRFEREMTWAAVLPALEAVVERVGAASAPAVPGVGRGAAARRTGT